MATQIEQYPLYNQIPVGQDIIFVVSNGNIVGSQINVRFIADVYVSDTYPSSLSITSIPTATFKTTPNNAGVGIFDFRQVLENYVSADNMAFNDSQYKGTLTTNDTPHPIHLIDKYSKNKKIARWFNVEFKTQYTDTNGDVQIDTPILYGDNFQIYNSYLKYTDKLDIFNNSFGFSLGNFNLSAPTNKFLTNAPATQYANLEDYGTFALLDPSNRVGYIRLKYKNSSGVQIGTEDIDKTFANGAYTSFDDLISQRILFFGCFPANLMRDGNSIFAGLVSPTDQMSGGSIEITAFQTDPVSDKQISKTYTININCPELKGFEPIRLCWLNQWGAWDYYTFTKRSARSISTQGSTYEQLAGTWNEAAYRLDSFKGGKKSFRVNATEKITINTDFVSESENVMFEELINSPEAYILDGYQSDGNFSALNQYVTPVRLTTSSFTKKTVANDKLIQYTFEVEKTKTLRTQSV